MVEQKLSKKPAVARTGAATILVEGLPPRYNMRAASAAAAAAAAPRCLNGGDGFGGSSHSGGEPAGARDSRAASHCSQQRSSGASGAGSQHRSSANSGAGAVAVEPVEWDGWSTSSAASSPLDDCSSSVAYLVRMPGVEADSADDEADAQRAAAAPPPPRECGAEALPVAGASLPQLAAAAAHGEHPLTHCWAPTKASSFMVRHGPNYKRRGLKVPSAPALYEVVAVDWFTCAGRKADNVGARVLLPAPPHASPHPSIPSIIIVNAQLPLEAPSMVAPALDGPTLQCVFYLALSAEAARALAAAAAGGGGALPPALQLLRDWCEGAEADAHTRSRFKAMARINNLHDAGLPGPVVQNNGRPTLITKSGTVTSGVGRVRGGGSARYLELDCNVRHWCFLARRALRHLLPRAPRVHLSIGFVIEGRADAELPEQILGCCELGGVDPDRAVELAP
ncbi:hypothetical protein JKP88DRAFT_298347 [Tribonema minus]|uniref:Protein ENHANCED DISEASE RESISTANCE 2 C-terminal domain-containing protein n=1 Tax=Tribonema minus TaxID=303371 RepID=A0A835ZBF7_9STRA|nr:hypothetical protein JKP88DRAFT_298347 [Tribonema minus]